MKIKRGYWWILNMRFSLIHPSQIASAWRYRQLAKGVKRHEFDINRLKAEGYRSQFGQDKWVAETLCADIVSGVFVDIGAHDGVSLNNSLYLEQRLGWTGIAVEPIPEVYEKLRQNRKCAVVSGCVGAKSGRVRFEVVSGYPQMLSGLPDEYDPRHRKRIENELRMYGGERHEIEVDCYTLNDLLGKHGIGHVDYLSIDVEGAEFAILKAMDFGRCDISVIGVENHYGDYRIPQLLKKKGFQFNSIVGIDEFYVKRK